MRRILTGLLIVCLAALVLAAPAHADTSAPTITLVASNSLSYQHQSATVTGTVTTSAGPVANLAVTLTCTVTCSDATVTTDSNGQFTELVTAADPAATPSVTAAIAASATSAATTQTLTLGVVHSPLQLTLTSSVTRITQVTQNATLSGTLEYQNDSGAWQPLPSQVVKVGETDGSAVCCSSATTTTQADGSYSTPLTLQAVPSQGGGRVLLYANWTPDSTSLLHLFFPTGAFTRLYIGSPWLSTINNVHIAFVDHNQLYVSGSISLSTLRSENYLTLNIEYSADGATGWQTVGTVQTGALGTTAANNFEGRPKVTSGPGYYRTELPEAPDFAGSASDVVQVKQLNTSIWSFSPTVDALGQLKITGTVVVFYPGAASGGSLHNSTSVRIEYSPDGKSNWKTLATPSLGTDATFFYTGAVPLAQAYYRASVTQGLDYTAAQTSVVYAGRTLTRVVGFQVSTTRVHRRGSFTISGQLQQYTKGAWRPLAGQKVEILLRFQNDKTKTWYWYSKPVTAKNGHFTVTVHVTSTMQTAYWIPVFVGATGYYASAPSTPILVRIT